MFCNTHANGYSASPSSGGSSVSSFVRMTNFREWHFCQAPISSDIVCLQGQIESDRRTSETTRLTPTRNRSWRIENDGFQPVRPAVPARSCLLG